MWVLPIMLVNWFIKETWHFNHHTKKHSNLFSFHTTMKTTAPLSFIRLDHQQKKLTCVLSTWKHKSNDLYILEWNKMRLLCINTTYKLTFQWLIYHKVVWFCVGNLATPAAIWMPSCITPCFFLEQIWYEEERPAAWVIADLLNNLAQDPRAIKYAIIVWPL